jgi:hypothetical protein
VLIAESFDAIVEKLNKANAIFHSRNINGWYENHFYRYWRNNN